VNQPSGVLLVFGEQILPDSRQSRVRFSLSNAKVTLRRLKLAQSVFQGQDATNESWPNRSAAMTRMDALSKR
jgi:hypothetical protein